MNWQRVIVKASVGAVLVFFTTWTASGAPDAKASLLVAAAQAVIAFLTDVQDALEKEPAGRLTSLKDKLLKLARYV
ncbi:MAG: hypothetical protein PHQ80_03485 [Candidatus ainarchaeum sp.]|nr:hypothetical protein [Candidatus ainarchaeum sp.]